jgi:four helix bundle protein
MPMIDVHELEVREKAHEVSLSVYRATRTFPPDEEYELGAQMRRAVAAISENLAVGCGGDHPGSHHFLKAALGAASELQNHLLLARHLGFMTDCSLEMESREFTEMLARFVQGLNSGSMGEEVPPFTES